MTTDKELIDVAKERNSIPSNARYEFQIILNMLKNEFIAGAEWQKTRWNEGVNVPDTEHEKGQHRDILILDKRSKVVFIGWYDVDLNRYFQCDENKQIKPETIMWQEIYLPE